VIKRLGSFALPLFLAASASAQLPSELEGRLDALFTEKAGSDVPGLVAGIVKDGKLVYGKGFGLGSMEQLAPLGPKSVIDVGSVTKHFTSTAILLLEDEGKLSLDDEVRKWIPSLPDFGKPITIRRLLNHTSGLRDYFTLFALKGWQLERPITPAEVVDLMADQQDLNFAPGTSFNYCNTGYVLASEIVQKAAKEPMGAYLKRRVFTPLGMNSTLLNDNPATIIPRRVDSYRKAGTTWQRLSAPAMTVGDGGLYSSIEDFAKWDIALKNDTIKLKKGRLLDRLTDTSGFPAIGTNYGLGLFVDTFEGAKRIQHGGDWLGFNAQYSMFPEKGFSVITFANEGTQIGKSLNYEASKLMLASMATAPAASVKEGEKKETPWPGGLMSQMEGDWTAKGAGAELKITFRTANGRPELQAVGQPALKLYALSDTQIFVKEVDLVISRTEVDATGKWTKATLEQKVGNTTVKLEMSRATPFVMTQEQAEGLAGKYWSPELKEIYTLKVVQNRVAWEQNGQSLFLTMSSPTKGTVSMVTLNFVMDASGRATGAKLDAGRAVGIRLEKLK
jgi:CubicO group peptidase (beta-lactamase class C family)